MTPSATGTVRAAVLRQVGAPFEVEEITLEPVGPRDVRVRMAASGVCHSDLSVQNGTIPFMFPTVLGHEGSGVVAEVGTDVTRVTVGDHVVLTWMPPCRQCFWCLAGQPMLCTTGMAESLGGPYGSVGGTKLIRGLGTATFAEETLVPERQVVPVDRAAPLELAALVGCALSTGIGAVWHTAGVEPGSTVAVIGCGGVGLSVIQGARLAGASTIVAVDHMGSKLDAARSVGATDVVDSSQEDAVAAVQARTDGRGVDYAFEVVGRASTIRVAFEAARRGGTAVLVGAGSPSDQVAFSAFELFVGAKTLVGCVYGSTDPDRDFPSLVDLVTRGTIDAETMVSRRIGLDDINDAFRAMEAGEVVRSVIAFDGARTDGAGTAGRAREET
ncbi:MAG TPA: Zn-dependent alcohol dehydrogenase [Acidimicrobiales bacterium]|nr:Zn-dependent alcohol dehydrogenase [Acidimicrobiales bacterium]